MEKITQYLDDEFMGRNLDDLIQLGVDLHKKDLEMESEQALEKEQKERKKRATAVVLAREFLPHVLRPFLKFDRWIKKKHGEFGWSQWFNTVMRLELDDMARIELRFCYYPEKNDNDPSIFVNNDKPDQPVAVLDCEAMLDEFGDEGWFVGWREVGNFRNLAKALKYASEIGDRREKVAKDCEIKSRLGTAIDATKPDRDPAPTFDQVLSDAIRGIIRDEIRAQNEPF